MEERGNTESIADIEARHPNEWLGLVIPPEEDEFAPTRAMLVVHSFDDNEVWDVMNRVTRNQVVHIYFNGVMNSVVFEAWAHSEPMPPMAVSASPWGGDVIPLQV
jgi:hypothetical protein